MKGFCVDETMNNTQWIDRKLLEKPYDDFDPISNSACSMRSLSEAAEMNCDTMESNTKTMRPPTLYTLAQSTASPS